jgi:hypothetical protein
MTMMYNICEAVKEWMQDRNVKQLSMHEQVPLSSAPIMQCAKVDIYILHRTSVAHMCINSLLYHAL